MNGISNTTLIIIIVVVIIILFLILIFAFGKTKTTWTWNSSGKTGVDPPSNSSTLSPSYLSLQGNQYITSNCCRIIQNMRKLWTEHVVWTRNYIISNVHNLSDVNEVAARLLKNQQDIGNYLGTFFGSSAGQQIANLLTTHINQSVLIVNAAKTNDPNLNNLIQQWGQNGNDIATALSNLSPKITYPQMQELMKAHLDTTLQEATDIIKGNDQDEVNDFDTVYNHILMMSDYIASALC